jgi:hypothetical protein
VEHHVTLEDLRAALRDSRDAIVGEMREGFRVIGGKQDLTNGRVLSLEGRVSGHETTLSRLSRTSPRGGGEHASITRREVNIALWTIGVCVAVLKGLPWLLSLARP